LVNATTDTQIAPLGEYFGKLGKKVIAVFDKQDPVQKAAIEANVHHTFEAQEKGFEDVILKGIAEPALRRYALGLIEEDAWPQHLADKTPTEAMPIDVLREVLRDYLRYAKGEGDAADLLGVCSLDEMPEFIVNTLAEIQTIVEPPSVVVVEDHSQDDAVVVAPAESVVE